MGNRKKFGGIQTTLYITSNEINRPEMKLECVSWDSAEEKKTKCFIKLYHFKIHKIYLNFVQFSVPDGGLLVQSQNLQKTRHLKV